MKKILAISAVSMMLGLTAHAAGLRETVFPTSVSPNAVVYMTDDTGEYEIPYTNTRLVEDAVNNLQIEPAGERAVDLANCRCQLSMSVNGDYSAKILHKDFLGILFFDALIDENGYMKRVELCDSGLLVSKETYKIDMTAFEEAVKKRAEVFGGYDDFILTGKNRCSFLVNYIKRFNPEIIETTALTFAQRSGAVSLSLEPEDALDHTDFKSVKYSPIRDEKAENGMFALSDGEYIEDYDYTDTDMRYPSYWYYSYPAKIFTAEGKSREFYIGELPRVLRSAALNGTAYWEYIDGMKDRTDYGRHFGVLYSDGHFSKTYKLYCDEWEITEIPRFLPNGITEFCRSEGRAHMYASNGKKCSYWLGYGGDHRLVKYEIPKLSSPDAAGDYKLFYNEFGSDGICYFSKDDVHFIACQTDGNDLKYVNDNATGEEYALIVSSGNIEKKIKRSDLDAAWEQYAAHSPTVILNRNVLSFEENPYIEDDITMIPLRFLFEEMGAAVTWNEESQSAKITLGDKNIRVRRGSEDAYVNNEKHQMTKPLIIKNGRSFVPIRFVSEALGYDVTWDNGVIYIDDGKPHKGEYAGEARFNVFDAYINGQSVENVNIGGFTYVPVSVLNEYGLNIVGNTEYKIIDISRSGEAPTEHSKSEKNDVLNAYRAYTDVYIDGSKTDAYFVDGNTYIMIDSLAKYGSFSFDGDTVRVDFAK